MTKNMNKKLLCFCLVVLMLASLMCGMFCFNGIKNAKGAQLSEVSLQSSYSIGEELVIPDANITVGDETVPAKAILVMPDGNAVSVDSLVFSSAGRYEIRYEAEIDGRIYRQSRFFNVNGNLFSVSGKASYSYGTNSYLPGVNGLNLNMDSSGVFRLNKPIDFRNYTADDYFIKLYVTPKEVGQIEVGAVIIKLIDAHNSNNVVTISNNGIFDSYTLAKQISMARVGANGQPLTGFRATYNDAESRYPATTLLANNHASYGVDTKVSMYATPAVDFVDSFVGFRFDLENNAVYTNGSPLRRDYYNSKDWNVDEQQSYLDAVAAGKPTIDLVADLDNQDHFTNVWEGFTTGEAFIEISFENMKKIDANVFITSIASIEGAELNLKEIEDRALPIIDLDYQQEDLPTAVVGHPYTIPDAKSLDVYNDKSIASVKVYQAYGSNSQVEVMVQPNNTFIPTNEGVYYLVYSAINRYGDCAEKVLKVAAVEESSVPTLSISYDNSAVKTGYVGESITIANYSVENALGETEVDVSVFLNNEKIAVDSKLVPSKAGTYTVKYSVKDFAGRTAQTEYDIVIENYAGPIFVDTLELPKYFSANMKYDLPEYYAYELTSGSAKPVACGYPEVTDKNGTRTLTSYEYTPEVANDGDVITVKYKATFNGITEVIERKIPCYTVYDAGTEKVDLGKLFVASSGVSMDKRNNHIRYSFSSDATLEYINAFDFSQLNVSFYPISENGNADFEKLNVYLQGSLNPDQKIKITFVPKGDKTLVSINDGALRTINNSLLENTNTKFTVKYNKGGVNVATGVTLYADNFNGFDGEKIYFSMEFVGVKSETVYAFSSFSGHTLSGTTKDGTAPIIILKGIYSGEISINSKHTFSAQTAMDVVDPNVTNLTFTLTGVDGKPMRDVNGLELNGVDARKEYTVEFSEYGKYTVKYTAKDCFNKTKNQSFYIKVVDHIAPTISLTGSYSSTGTINKEINVASINVSEFESDASKVQTYVFVKHNGIYTIVENNKFIPKEKGEYEVIYYVQDVNNNFSTISYKIMVEG